jgi:preprotein translocase subunit SecE
VAKQTAPAPQDKTQSSRPARRAAGAGGSGRGGIAVGAGGRSGGNSIVDFYRESVAELKKVTWPTWQDATNLTLAVIGMTLAVAAFLGIVDEALNYIIKPLIGS